MGSSGSAPPPRKFLDTAVLNEQIVTTQNLITKIFGSGASAADISAQITATSTLFAEAKSKGSDILINSTIAANAAKIQSLGPNFTNAQISSIFSNVQKILPSITQADVYSALAGATISSGTKSTLLNQGIVTVQQSYISLLQAVENTLNGGVILATSGIVHSSRPQIRYAECVLYDVGVTALGVSAILTDGLSLGVVAGVEITWPMLFGALATAGGIVSPDVKC